VNKIDSKIIQCIQKGENDPALAYLYEHTLKKVRRYVIQNNGTLEEASDIFQDAVIIFFNQVKQNKFNEQYGIDGFIYSVSRNLWIDKVRKDKRLQNKDLSLMESDVPDTFDLLGDLITREKSSAMKQVFQKLDEKCQKILRFSIYEKLSMKEISEKMGYASENVAKTNNYRCKQYLQKLVNEDKNLLNLLKH
jgi:RNA polymerase sigma factor (sigma-70 family)